MGSSAWSSDDYSHLKKSYTTKSTDDLFVNNKTKKVAADMDPKGITFRESRDSVEHPESLAVCVWLDETGSMGEIPEILVREKLGSLMDTLITHDIKDAHILFGAIGDHHSDRHPLQVGQFEAGAKELTHWLTSAYLEGNGGGQNKESYLLAWLISGKHTSIDCFEKRNQKGILFTIGDEKSWEKMEAQKLKDLLGYNEASDMTDHELLSICQNMYHVFHIHVNQTQYKDSKEVIGYWQKLLPERLIILDDYNQIAETIAATVAMIHGVDLADVVKGFDSATADGVTKALAKVDATIARKGTTEGVIKL